MKNTKIIKFEDRITETFIKFGRFPLFIVIGLVILVSTSLYLYTNVYQVLKIKEEATQYFDTINIDIDKFISGVSTYAISDSNNIDKRLYQLFYEFNADYISTNQVIVFNNNREPIFITNPALFGNYFSQVYLSYVLDQSDINSSTVSTLNLMSDEPTRYAVFSNVFFDENGMKYYAIVFFNTENFQTLINRQRSNHFIITDRFNTIICTTTPEVERSAFKFNSSDSEKIELHGLTYNIIVNDIFEEAVTLHVLVQNSYIMQFLFALVITTLVVFYFLMRTNRKMAKKIGKDVSESVNVIVDHVKEIQEGKLDSQVVLKTNDELQFLSEAINEMSAKLHNLLKSNERLIELRKNAEIRQLEAQFNPHFIFNSLETMRYLIEEDPSRAQDMIVNLSRLLRYSIANDQTEIPFVEESKYIQMYLDIHKERLGDRLNYTIDIDKALDYQMIPKLIIQPLVENSIKHGYKHQDNLNIGVIAYTFDNFIYIHVIDDGQGISEDLVHKLNNLKNHQTDPEIGFGVSSVIQRVNLIYGNNGSVFIESDKYGTYITICFKIGGYYDI